MMLDSSPIEWVNSIKYLGVSIVGGKTLSFNSDIMKQSFFAAFNCIYAHARNLDEIIHLILQETYCLPILTYAIAAIKLSAKQIDELDAAWNSVYRKIFDFHKWASVKCFICCLGRIDLRHLVRIRRVNFYFHVLPSGHYLLTNIFECFFSDNIIDETDLLAIFGRRPTAIDPIVKHFRSMAF
jgi:hypothetical protein